MKCFIAHGTINKTIRKWWDECLCVPVNVCVQRHGWRGNSVLETGHSRGICWTAAESRQ